MKDRKDYLLICISILLFSCTAAQPLSQKKTFSHQDSLRGSITPERSWWDVRYYDITVRPDFNRKWLSGSVMMKFQVVKQGSRMQVDLQLPMQITAVKWKDQLLDYTRDSNVYYIRFPDELAPGKNESILISYEGRPREAVTPPWDGGWIWKTDKNGNPWMTVACQGLGASVWYPCKDHQGDEPDSAMLRIRVPDGLTAVGNGKLREKIAHEDHTTTFVWAVSNPINNYNIIPYIGKYVHFSDDYPGLKGRLNVDYWVLDYNLDTARKHMMADVRNMLACFEHWFGPYPFYEDGYKLVDAPHLGMEHQSAIAYGNHYRKGYAGKDLSGTGWGLKWDFIIVHESGHEWFGNNITTNDVADMWVHESFTNYSETLFTECQFGKEAGNDYVIGTRKLIENVLPITGIYGVNQEGSGDMYYKGGNMLHTIRQVINNDEKFRSLLTGMNRKYYHQTVNGADIEHYISENAGIDFSKVFDQYLRTTKIPVLEYKMESGRLQYRWTNCVDGFDLPLKIMLGKEIWIKPLTRWQSIRYKGHSDTLQIDRNFYVEAKKLSE